MFLALLGCHAAAPADVAVKAVVIISANAEWKIVTQVYPGARYAPTPWGETFERAIDGARVVYLHGGWAKSPRRARRSTRSIAGTRTT